MKPEELLFNETHEWVHVQDQEGGTVGTVGISEFAVQQLNDLVYIELPQPGQRVRAGDEFGEVESVKAVSPLYSPVDGEVIEVHRELADKLELLGEDPYGAGWIIRVRIDDKTSLGRLLNHAAYQKQCAEEQ